MGCAAALAVLDIIRDEDLCGRAAKIGQVIRERIDSFAQRADAAPIGPCRGQGAMIGFDVFRSRESRTGDGARAKEICAKALEQGLIVLTCGASGEAIRLLPPLTVSDEVLHEGLDKLEAALLAAAKS